VLEQLGEGQFEVGDHLVGVVARRLMLLLEMLVKVSSLRGVRVMAVVMEKAVLRFGDRQASEGGMYQW
jgi:hypothetical protein